MASTPANEQELYERSQLLAGCSLQQLANQLNESVPASLHQAKGWLGTLLEKKLGATAGSLPQPDFPELGIELKTLPINSNGFPRESTYVCVVQLGPANLGKWHDSLVRKKLSRVLWIPYEADSNIPIGARRIGNPVLWEPDIEQEQQLREDWQELTDMIVLGNIEQISSSMGKYLQIRPKAANARMTTTDHNQPDTGSVTLPRGFYLRSRFTGQIINNV
ncbi:MAG: DNA mismatch repair endonuclease MutH [Gammaproteobacteria bacterium]